MINQSKKGMELEVLGYWIIGLTILVILIIGTIVMKGKGTEAIDFVKNLFRFGS
jgi:hypothetical protein